MYLVPYGLEMRGSLSLSCTSVGSVPGLLTLLNHLVVQSLAHKALLSLPFPINYCVEHAETDVLWISPDSPCVPFIHHEQINHPPEL